MEKTHTVAENCILPFNLKEGLGKNWVEVVNQKIQSAQSQIKDLLLLVPPSRIEATEHFCTGILKRSGVVPEDRGRRSATPLTWLIGCSLLLRDKNGGVWDICAYKEETMHDYVFDSNIVFTCLCFGQMVVNWDNFVVSEAFVDVLQEKTCLERGFVETMVWNACLETDKLPLAFMQFLQSDIRISCGADTAFLFNKALFLMFEKQLSLNIRKNTSQERKKYDKILLDSMCELKDIAAGLKETKSFSKSKVIKSYRERLEKTTQELGSYFKD